MVKVYATSSEGGIYILGAVNASLVMTVSFPPAGVDTFYAGRLLDINPSIVIGMD